MKLTDTQVNELITATKSRLKKQVLSSKKTINAIATLCDPQSIENAVCETGLWDELNTLEPYMNPKQVNWYSDEVSMEIYMAFAREVRNSNPLLAKAFDLTK